MQDGDWLHYDPMNMPTVQVVEALPSNAEHIQTISMYYAHGNFFIVPYDASTCQVGDGSGNETGDWAEDNAGDDEHSWADWDSLGFTSIDDGNSSLAKIHGTQLSLYRHREDQKAWVEQLLPTTYHPAPANQAALNGQGGMAGTLGILLGLIAFSAPESKESVTAAMRQCMQAHAWRPHTYEKGAGCTAPRSKRTSGRMLTLAISQGKTAVAWSCGPTDGQRAPRHGRRWTTSSRVGRRNPTHDHP